MAQQAFSESMVAGGLLGRPRSISLLSASSLSSRLSSSDTRSQGMELKHGLLPDYQNRVSGHIKSVIYHPHSQSSVVHHIGGFSVYSRGGLQRTIQSTELSKRVLKLLYDEAHSVYVGVCAGSLVLLNGDFECIYEREMECKMSSGEVNYWTEEVVTCGMGHITSLMFKQGGKVIAPVNVINDGLSSGDEVRLVHIEAVPGKAQRCFAVLETGVKVYLMSTGKLLASLDELHSRTITALVFFRPLRLLITAARDGAIKVWDSNWSLVCTFVGHSGSVTSLTAHPYGPMVVSGARDCTIRVWNLATHDQVEILPHTTPVEGVSCVPGVYRVLSHSSRQLRGWRVRQLYHQSALTGPVLALSATTHPLVPLRVLAACADSAVRLVSPVAGQVISTALLPVQRTVWSMAYFSLLEVLHVLDDQGIVTVFDTRANPAIQTSSWSAPQEIGCYSCLCLYEVASDDDDIEESLAADKWLNVTLQARQLSHIQLSDKSPLDKSREGHSLLLAGTSLGHVALLDSKGKVCYSTEGPSEGPVLLMTANPHRSQLITAGQNGGLDVWRLYPHTAEPLSHILSFSLSTSCPPSVLISTKDRLCVASNNIELASYSIDMFDLTEKMSFTGEAEFSHTDRITALDACVKLRLFASASHDCTVRVWTDDNHPVRVLRLNSPPNGLVFCSAQADLMIALHSHLHIITNTTYINEALRKQLVSTQFPDPISEAVRQCTVSLDTLSQEDRDRLQLVDNTISQDDYRGALSAEEMAALEAAAEAKALCLQAIAHREEEIRAIRDGQLTASSKKSEHAPLKGKERDSFWKELLAVLRPGEPRLTITIPEVDDFDPDGTMDTPASTHEQFEKGPRYKFFPPLATFDPPYPLAPDGYLPNSVLLKGLRKSQADQELAQGWSPPTISDKQRKLLQEMEELDEEVDETESEHDDELMARLQAALSASHHSPTPSPSPPPTPSPPPPPKKVLAPLKPIQKLIAPKAPPKLPTPPRTPTPPPPKSPTPPPTPPTPPTPLPEFIAQFIGQPWFEKLFPNANSKTFPKPWTVTKFVYSLLACLSKPVDSITKGDLCTALLKLLLAHSPANKNEVYTAVLSMLTTPPCPSPQSMAERHLILAALKLLFQQAEFGGRLAALMMTHYVLGDAELRRLIANQLTSVGLVDPEGYFERLLSKESVNVGSVEDVLVWSEGWLNEWAEQLATSKGAKLLKAPLPAKRSLKSTVPAKRVSNKRSKVSFAGKSVSPTIPSYKPMDVINHYVTVEHEAELARNRVITPPPPPPPREPEDELPHNTVVALPKINRQGGLIRLGETHCSCCHPDRESSLALLHRLPPHYNTPQPSDPTKLWKHFTHCLTLALKPQNINPFLSEEEKQAEREMEDYLRAQRLSIGSMVKYFIPERSYVNSDT